MQYPNRPCVQTTVKKDFQVQLHNRFALLQDMGSESSQLKHDSAYTQPSMVTLSTSSNILAGVPDTSCRQNDSLKIFHDNDTKGESQYPQSQDDQPVPLETNSAKIPVEVLMNKTNCVDYVNCSEQNGTHFGFIPLTPLQVYTGAQTFNTVIQDLVALHGTVKASNLPNFMSCRIPLESQLNITNWRKYLINYWDQQLSDLLAFGFPLDFDRSCPLQATEINHASAVTYSQHIDKYLQDEIQYGAIYGPFDSKPFPLHVSPFMTREKSGTSKRRAIVDLSWPHGCSVNAGVEKNKYLGTYFELRYPSIDNIVQAVKEVGPSALMFKIDISRAFRHLKIDPRDLDLLGLCQNKYFIDGSLPFGFRHGSTFFQRCSDAIRYIMASQGYTRLYNYIDDLLYIGPPDEIYNAYNYLLDLLQQLGLEISQEKLVPPTTSLICLGIQVDVVTKTISIPQAKLHQIHDDCKGWVGRKTCTKRQLQSLLGSLLYITKCVRYSRYFLNRMLEVLRQHTNKTIIKLTNEFFKDLQWFLTLLNQYNGVTFYDNRKPSASVHLDASLTGLGGVYDKMVYALDIPKGYMDYSIVHLEILNIMVALKVWGSSWKDKYIEVFCDNLAVVQVLKTGRAKDIRLATFVRNIWLITSIFNIHLAITHIPGKSNSIGDLLSRWTDTPDNQTKLCSMKPIHHWIPTHLDLTLLNYQI